MLWFPGGNCNLSRVRVCSVVHLLDVLEVSSPEGQIILKANCATNVLGQRFELPAANVFAVPNNLSADENERECESYANGKIAGAPLTKAFFPFWNAGRHT